MKNTTAHDMNFCSDRGVDPTAGPMMALLQRIGT
jgi:hypothetical protein